MRSARGENPTTTQAKEARHQYVRLGPGPVDRDELLRLVPEMEKSPATTFVGLALSHAQLDLATHPDTPQDEKRGHLKAAGKHLGHQAKPAETTTDQLPRNSVAYEAAMMRSFMGKYGKVVEANPDRPLNETHDKSVYGRLLGVGGMVLHAHNVLRDVSPRESGLKKDLADFGAQLATHTLIARTAAQEQDDSVAVSWPALKREEIGRQDDGYSQRWNLSIADRPDFGTTSNYTNVDRLHVVNNPRRRLLVPEIVPFDYGVVTSASPFDTINAARLEANPEALADDREAATEWLDGQEDKLFDYLDANGNDVLQ